MEKNILGASIFIGVICGGNSSNSYFLDGIIQIVVIIASTYVIWKNIEETIDNRATKFIIILTACILIQVLPLPSTWLDRIQGIMPVLDGYKYMSYRTISLNIGRTIEEITWIVSMEFLFIALLKIRFDRAYSIIPLFLLGVACHLVTGLIQYSFSSEVVSPNIVGFPMRAGMFANENHFSALCFVSIPVACAYFFDRKKFGLFVFYVSFVLIILLAVGSRAGVFIGFAITLLSTLIIFQRRAISTLFVFTGAGLAGLYFIGVWARVAQEGLQQGSREIFSRTTIEGIWDNLVVGIGYGNFVDAYRYYESVDDIFYYYTNHAHNDFLELAFEGGIPAMLLIITFLVLVLKRVAETYKQPLRYACGLSILFLMVHSVVDYPLRTMALSITFTMLTALLFHRGADPADSTDDEPAADERKRYSDGMVAV